VCYICSTRFKSFKSLFVSGGSTSVRDEHQPTRLSSMYEVLLRDSTLSISPGEHSATNHILYSVSHASIKR